MWAIARLTNCQFHIALLRRAGVDICDASCVCALAYGAYDPKACATRAKQMPRHHNMLLPSEKRQVHEPAHAVPLHCAECDEKRVT